MVKLTGPKKIKTAVFISGTGSNLKNNSFLKKELLRPTKIYVKEVLNLIDSNLLNGCANITGVD